ncbi:hypothetical protein [Streptomyces sp. VRA16 Mangrove soil]|uniref:hypothetical protein n=1 Tax=Streptomyces sp. VRA16 Mangrove soil TaxID=2817434 RepID=UPI001A9F09C6|nr:hypothetical protein [Streptomyces sp. VRA16 Mangrove soil]MBO1333877.1 hypothetical protein [Streptomyces sp. VRA16 Mangrove soil]
MPTPYGNRGGMAFGAEELRVLRRALALALHPSPASDKDVRDCLRLAESVDEATQEAARMRTFLLADLDRYRAALPGSVTGYLKLLEDALAAGHRPGADDLAGLRALRGNPAAAVLLDRCRALAEQGVRERLEARHRPRVPASRARLLALPGGLAEADPQPAGPRPAAPQRPAPKPSEVFPPKRRPAQPPAPPQQLAAG